MHNVNPFDFIFERVYLRSFNPVVKDMLSETIGVLEEERDNPVTEAPRNEPEISYEVEARSRRSSPGA